MNPSCPDLIQTYRSLLLLKDAFGMERKEAVKSGDFSKLEELRKDILEKQVFIESHGILFEKELKIKEQYESQKEILEKNALLETRNGVLGIEGIDKNKTFYPFPQLKDIAKELRNNKEFFKTKLIEQKISKMRIEPFALPVIKKIRAYDNALKRHCQEGKLFAGGTKKLPFTDMTQPIEDMYVWEKYQDGDTNGSMVYDPETLTATNHNGKTKKDILSKSMTFPGFKIFFVEEKTVIPREGVHETVGGRKRIEANKSAKEYLALLKTKAYAGESPLSIDDWIMHALTVLETKNQVIDDFGNEEDSACLCTGSFFPNEGTNGYVSNADWDRGVRQAYAGRFGPSNPRSDRGFRASVRVGSL